MSAFEREWLLEILRSGKVTVRFTKNDGSERKMLCTLMENEIPSEKMPKNSEKAKNDGVIPVFDVEKQDWRSFRIDSVVSISI